MPKLTQVRTPDPASESKLQVPPGLVHSVISSFLETLRRGFLAKQLLSRPLPDASLPLPFTVLG